ncbi:MAG: hypothetical protein AAGD25_14005 [Cyanobacteria bacterium P01_F01_bin.150]
MTQTSSSTSFDELIAERDRWLADQIRQLSVDVLSQSTFTCTECGEVAGDYIINKDGNTFRLKSGDAYALLKFIAQRS